MKTKRFAMIGAGFWAQFQLAAWGEVEGAECVAVYNRTRSKAADLAREFGVSGVYDDADALFAQEELDFVDIVVGPESHDQFVRLAADHGLPIICQKPFAPSVAIAEGMLEACRQAGVPLTIHENWRWQTPIRKVRALLDTDVIGSPFRARIDMITGFPVFENQPFLKEIDQFILTDLGTHILDVARFLFGEAQSVYCHTHQVHQDIRGEDVATVVLRMTNGASVVCNLAYAGNPHEFDRFPETYMYIEGPDGTIELAPDYWVRTTTTAGTHSQRVPPPRYAWADPQYDLVQASIVPCNRHLLAAINGEVIAETTAEDNLKTLRLVHDAYDSAASGESITATK